MKPKIEKAQTEDMEAILQLQYAAYQSEAAIHNDYTIQPLRQTLDELTEEFRKSVILKMVLNGVIIGSVRAYADGDTVYIGKLMVHPDHQGKGLEKRLLTVIEGHLHRKRFELFTSSKSDRNLSLYEKAGYTRFKEETDESGITFAYFEKKYDDGAYIAYGICFGMLAGVVIGSFTDNLSLWISLGMCFGICISVLFGYKGKTKKK